MYKRQGNRLLPIYLQYRYLHFCIPAHRDNDFLTGAFYHLRHVTAVSYTHLTFQGAEVDWYIKADDIVLKKGAAMNPQSPKKEPQAEK